MTEENTTTKKVGFDGRMAYMYVLGGYLNTIAENRLSGNLLAWRDSLMALLTHVSPYVDSAERVKIERILRGVIQNTSRNAMVIMEQALHIAHTRLNDLARDIYLPTTSEDYDDLENFFK